MTLFPCTPASSPIGIMRWPSGSMPKARPQPCSDIPGPFRFQLPRVSPTMPELFPGPAGKPEEIDRMGKPLSKSDLISKLAEENDGKLTRKDVKGVLESLATIGYKELKKTGIFLVPGFAKFVVIKKPATKERKGINPFTKEPTVFKAKPARKIVRARPVKAAKDAV